MRQCPTSGKLCSCSEYGMQMCTPRKQDYQIDVLTDDPVVAIPFRPAQHGSLGNTASERKTIPIATGFLDYFPDAVAAIAECSFVANEQHNPGSPVHWDRSKSQDEADAQMRHFVKRGTFDSDGIRHSTKNAWRALALLQKEIEDNK